MARMLGILFLVCLSTPVLSQERMRGVITKVDQKNGRIYLETRGLRLRRVPLTLEMRKETRIQVGAESGTLADLQTGQRVRLLVGSEGMTMIALVVQVPGLLRGAPEPSVPTPVDTPPNVVIGELRRVSYFEREIVVLGEKLMDGRRKETIIQIPAKVQVLQDGEPITYEELTDGQQASIKTRQQNGDLVAERIQAGAGSATFSQP